jgi:NADP-dependent 3-hydroxy acid dehydrogenase YdfG
MTKLEGKSAVITGATSGIGHSMARALAGKGVNLDLVGRNQLKLDAVSQELKSLVPDIRLRSFAMDFSKSITGNVMRMLEGELVVDILLHCAGSIVFKSLDDVTESEFNEQISVNTRSPFLLTQLLLPKLTERKGQVVFLNSSVSRQKATGNSCVYAASKYALTAIADGVRDLANPGGVRVLSIYPGRTATPMQKGVHELENRNYQADFLLQTDDIVQTVISALLLPRTAEITDIEIRPLKKI